MAQQLWLLRHGEAEPHGERPDELRALTERGEHQARAAGAALRALGVRLDAVFTSPRVRASDTARGACAVYGEGALAEIYEPLSTGFDAASALALFDGRDPDAHIMVVGHEPTLAGAIAGLSGAQIKLKKGGIAMVDVSDASVLSANGAFQELTGGEAREPGEPPGELVVLVRPRELAHIAGMALSEV